jgi:hypothetical protein
LVCAGCGLFSPAGANAVFATGNSREGMRWACEIDATPPVRFSVDVRAMGTANCAGTMPSLKLRACLAKKNLAGGSPGSAVPFFDDVLCHTAYLQELPVDETGKIVAEVVFGCQEIRQAAVAYAERITQRAPAESPGTPWITHATLIASSLFDHGPGKAVSSPTMVTLC